ncbi:MAG: DUF975 family protein [Candidatus Moranbacteria bacterium]|nr:DUF975 family protein [Candidatus Moranbacteria bacterium]NTW45717.1 DUF975 family protein [Candidatus Moranbacteria bacterium]
MRTANADLMRSAREALRGKWGMAVGVTAAYLGIVMLLQSAKGVGPFVLLFISGPLVGGLTIFFLSASRGETPAFERLFDGFRRYTTYLSAYWLIVLFVFLWSLLLVIPGIVAAIAYSMTYFVIADDPSVRASEAMRRSKELMRGYGWKYVGLMFRFIGWIILALLTAGIGFLWLMPYMQVSAAKFYDDLRKADEKETIEAGEQTKDGEEAEGSLPESGVIDGDGAPADVVPEAV